MEKKADKDFGPIASDYVFFQSHATEAEHDSRAYAARLAQAVPAAGPIRMLDFGCGDGEFTSRLLSRVAWPVERFRLSLVEPVEAARLAAAERLARFTGGAVSAAPALPDADGAGFDFVLANHCLYYVNDLRGTLVRLIAAMAPSGALQTAIAGRVNPLIGVWFTAFELLDRDVPYHISEDVERELRQLGVEYLKEQVPYVLTFADSVENRTRIIRFLLADHLARLPMEPLLALFDPYVRDGQVVVHGGSDHYVVRARRDSKA